MHRALIVSALVVMSIARAGATVLLPADLGELSRDARTIVRGTVVSLDAQWTDDRRRVETIVTLEPEMYLKGPLGSVLRFRVPGGRLGRYRSIIVGAPEFAVGQHVVVFLGVRGAGVPYVLGLSQGVFRVVAGPSGWIVTPPAILPVSGRPVTIVRGAASRRAMPISDFEHTVRGLAEERR